MNHLDMIDPTAMAAPMPYANAISAYARYNCQTVSTKPTAAAPAPVSTAPTAIIRFGPRRSITGPTTNADTPDTAKNSPDAPETTPADQPCSSWSGRRNVASP